jgi:hypothetical protein
VTFEPPSRLAKIESEAFLDCDSLKSLCLPASLSAAEGFSFAGSSIETISVDAANLEFFASGSCLVRYADTTLVRRFGPPGDVVIGREYGALGPFSFSCHASIATVAFEDGTQLRRIGAGAFSYCSALKSISIPSCVTEIGHRCFDGCASLSEVLFASDSQLAVVGACAFQNCCALGQICVPAQVRRLPHECFLGCESLAVVAFAPNSKITGFDLGTFGECRALRAICIPSGVEYPGLAPFAGCTALSQLTFERPSRIRQIELPPSDFGVLDMPDSVEGVWAECPRMGGCSRMLRFGTESRLKGVSLTHIGRGSQEEVRGNGIFVRYPEETLRRFRRQEEGAWTRVNI